MCDNRLGTYLGCSGLFCLDLGACTADLFGEPSFSMEDVVSASTLTDACDLPVERLAG